MMTIDSGISQHIVNKLDYFIDIKETKEINLELADGLAVSTSTVER